MILFYILLLLCQIRQDPAGFDTTFALISREVLHIRYRLLPYLYTLFYESRKTGATVMRPLMFEYVARQVIVYCKKILGLTYSNIQNILLSINNIKMKLGNILLYMLTYYGVKFYNRFPLDKVCRTIDRQFLWGSAFLISPVLHQVSYNSCT